MLLIKILDKKLLYTPEIGIAEGFVIVKNRILSSIRDKLDIREFYLVHVQL